MAKNATLKDKKTGISLYPVTTTNNVYDSNNKTVEERLSECAPFIGEIKVSVIPLHDARVHLLDGGTISQTGIYSDFVTLLKQLIASGEVKTCTNEEFEAELVRYGGNCGKFVVDDTAGTIRLPKITRFIQGLDNIANIGTSLEAGLPNITGSVTVQIPWSGTNQNGALRTTSHTFNFTDGSRSQSVIDHIYMDASKSNATYKDNSTVQPQATQFPYYVVLANSYTTKVVVDINKVLVELNSKISQQDVTTPLVPSGEYIDLTSTTYVDDILVAPANGWYILSAISNNPTAHLWLNNLTNGFQDRQVMTNASGWGMTCKLPVKAGDSVQCKWGGVTFASADTYACYVRFYYGGKN